MNHRAATVMLVAFLLAAASAGPSRALDRVELWADAALSTCSIVDGTPRPVKVHMVHMGELPAFGVRFAAVAPACWEGAVWQSDAIKAGFRHSGWTQDRLGISVIYDVCLQPPVYLGYLTMIVSGTSKPCCVFQAGPASSWSTASVRAVDCETGRNRFGDGFAKGVTVNVTDACPCMAPVSVETGSWGRVKALYR